MTEQANYKFDPYDISTTKIVPTSVASYLAGRCTARLFFHWQQCALLGVRPDLRDAQGRQDTLVGKTIDAIRQLSYSLSAGDDRGRQLREQIERTRIDWQAEFYPDGQINRVDSANRQFAQRPPGSDSGDLCFQVIQDLVNEHFESIRRATLSVLLELDQRIFQVGECLEQGLCRPDIYRYLLNTPDRLILPAVPPPTNVPEEDEFEDIEKSNTAQDEEDASEAASVDAVEVSQESQTAQDEVVADTSWDPGDLQPQDTWMHDVGSTWKIAWPEEPEPAALEQRRVRRRSGQLVLRADLVAAVEALHEAACRILFTHAARSTDMNHARTSDTDLKTTVAPRTIEDHPRPAPISGSIPPGGEHDCVTAAGYTDLCEIKRRIDPDGEYIGGSLAILKMFEQIEYLNDSGDKGVSNPVLILGPSGAGKTVLAKLIALHGRPDGEFRREIATNVAGADQRIPLSNWTGYGKNSGIDAFDRKGASGFLQACTGGTIFLDELHKCNAGFQTFLHDVIDNKLISPAPGVAESFTPNVRLIFATSVPLTDLNEGNGGVSADLMRRLKPWTVQVPSLCERKEDIPLFVDKFCPKLKFEPAFLLALFKHDWPEQVGQLRAVLEIARRKQRAEKEKAPKGRPGGREEKDPKDQDGGKLRLEHLDLDNPELIKELRGKNADEIEGELYQSLTSILWSQGHRPHKGLQNRLSEILRTAASTVSGKFKLHCSKLPPS